MSDKGQERPWRGLAGRLGALVLGLVLLVAAWTKAIDPEAFVEQIQAERLDFLLSAPAVALVALGLEVGLGLALALGIRRWWVLVPAGMLLAFFLGLTGRSYWLASRGLLDEAGHCGCFGNLVSRSPAEAFWQDLLLLVPPYLLAVWGREAKGLVFPRWRLAIALVGAAAAVALAVRAPQLPLDDLATNLEPGVQLAALCAGSESNGSRVCLDTLAPQLERDRHLVVIADIESPAFVAEVDRLNGHALAGSGPRLWVLTAATPEAIRAFTWTAGPAFEVKEAPRELLRPLYRHLPRSFELVAGEVAATYNGLPPLAGESSGPN